METSLLFLWSRGYFDRMLHSEILPSSFNKSQTFCIVNTSKAWREDDRVTTQVHLPSQAQYIAGRCCPNRHEQAFLIYLFARNATKSTKNVLLLLQIAQFGNFSANYDSFQWFLNNIFSPSVHDILNNSLKGSVSI